MDEEISQRIDVASQKAKTAAIKGKWNHFIDNSTLHGMQNIFTSQTKVRSIIWAVFLLSGIAYFAYQSTVLLTAYFSYPITTKQTLEYETSPKFPAVTICNFNPVTRWSTRHIEEKLINWIFGQKNREMWNANPVNISSINWSDYENFSMEDFYRERGHPINMMLARCTWSGTKCSETNFTQILTSMGLCRTFNSGKDGKDLLSVKNFGVNFGLRMMLFVGQDFYYGLTAMHAGFKVLIHDQDTPPMVEELGFSVGPGTTTFAAIRKHKVINLEAPYPTNCSKDAIPGFTKYSTSSCMLTCRAKYVIEKCGCRDVRLPAPDNIKIPVCGFRDTAICVSNTTEHFYHDIEGHCNCPVPCEMISYQTVLSYASFPSNDFVPSFLPGPVNRSDVEQATKLLRENILELNVYFQDLSHQLTEQQPAYEKASIFGEIGGLLGLCVGASILTVLEFCDFIFTIFKLRFGRVGYNLGSQTIVGQSMKPMTDNNP